MDSGFKLSKNTLVLSIMTFLVVLTWVSWEVYKTATKSTIPEVTQKQMAPLNPKLKKETIEMLKNTLWPSEEELSNFNLSPEETSKKDYEKR